MQFCTQNKIGNIWRLTLSYWATFRSGWGHRSGSSCSRTFSKPWGWLHHQRLCPTVVLLALRRSFWGFYPIFRGYTVCQKRFPQMQKKTCFSLYFTIFPYMFCFFFLLFKKLLFLHVVGLFLHMWEVLHLRDYFPFDGVTVEALWLVIFQNRVADQTGTNPVN